MSYTITHKFKTCAKIIRPYVNINWYLVLRQTNKENEGYELILSGIPMEEIVRSDLDYRIEVDIKCTIGDEKPEFRKNSFILRIHKNCGIHSSSLMLEKGVQFPKNSKSSMKISVTLSNIRTIGLRKFKQYNFENLPTSDMAAGDTDVVLSIGDKSFHCHKQILSLNSEVLRKLIKEKKSKIILDENIHVENFLDLLHHIYHPMEVVDDQILRTLLPLAREFEATQVLEMCQSFMKEQLKDPSVASERKQDYFLFAWIYDIAPLKLSSIKELKLCEEISFSTLIENEIYQVIKEDQLHEFLDAMMYRAVNMPRVIVRSIGCD